MNKIGSLYSKLNDYFKKGSEFNTTMRTIGMPISNSSDSWSNEIYKLKRSPNLAIYNDSKSKGSLRNGINHHLYKWHFLKIDLFDQIRGVGKREFISSNPKWYSERYDD